MSLRKLPKDDSLHNVDDLQMDAVIGRVSKYSDSIDVPIASKYRRRTESTSSFKNSSRCSDASSSSRIIPSPKNSNHYDDKSAYELCDTNDQKPTVKTTALDQSDDQSDDHSDKFHEQNQDQNDITSGARTKFSKSSAVMSKCKDDDRGIQSANSHKKLVRNSNLEHNHHKIRNEIECLDNSIRSMSMSPRVIRTRLNTGDGTSRADDVRKQKFSSQQALNTSHQSTADATGQTGSSSIQGPHGSECSLDQWKKDHSGSMLGISQEFWKKVETKAAGFFSSISRRKE